MKTKLMSWASALLLAMMATTTSSHAASRSCEYQVIPDQIFATGLLEEGLRLPLPLDAYLPTTCADGPVGRTPALILIAGGGFNFVQRNRPKIVEIADGFARAGFAVFSIEHRVEDWNGYAAVSETKNSAELKAYQRSLKKSPYPGQQHFNALIAMEDGMKAKAWIAERADEFNLDMTRFGLVGGSSGACTVLGMEYTGEDIGLGIVDAQALVDMWGDFYPHTQMRTGEAPLLVLAGTEDPVIAYDSTTDMMRRAKAVQVDASRITMPGVKHGLDDADIFNRKVVGTDLTSFQAMVAFLENKLMPERGTVWPPVGQTREMMAEEYPPAPKKASAKVSSKPAAKPAQVQLR